MRALKLADVSGEVGVSASTLRRWVDTGLVETDEHGLITPAGVAQARLVARLRARGYSLAKIRQANDRGSLASSAIAGLNDDQRRVAIGRAARDAGIGRKLAERLLAGLGVLTETGEVGEREAEMLEHVADMLESGVPQPVILQLSRVYGQAMRQIADAEVRLIHHQVHEPMMDAGASPAEIRALMHDLVAGVLPLTTPILEAIHRFYLREFTEQDVIGHMEDLLGGVAEPAAAGRGLTRVRVAIAFADLAGFTRMTDELGDARAIEALERFMEAVVESLPDDARFVKTIGDEAMIVSPDVAGLARWATAFQAHPGRRRELRARIGMHCGEALFYQGDYYGREVNLAARLVARASEDEVVVTDAVAATRPKGVDFEALGEIRLRGFSRSTGILLATEARPDDAG